MMGAMRSRRRAEPGFISEQAGLFWGVICSMWSATSCSRHQPAAHRLWVQMLACLPAAGIPTSCSLCCIGVYSLNSSAVEVLFIAASGARYLSSSSDCEPAPLLTSVFVRGKAVLMARRTCARAQPRPSRGDPWVVLAGVPESRPGLLIRRAALVCFDRGHPMPSFPGRDSESRTFQDRIRENTWQLTRRSPTGSHFGVYRRSAARGFGRARYRRGPRRSGRRSAVPIQIIGALPDRAPANRHLSLRLPRRALGKASRAQDHQYRRPTARGWPGGNIGSGVSFAPAPRTRRLHLPSSATQPHANSHHRDAPHKQGSTSTTSCGSYTSRLAATVVRTCRPC
jgi:hypothetical protein